jgi:hypothetical protein
MPKTNIIDEEPTLEDKIAQQKVKVQTVEDNSKFFMELLS